MSAALLEEFGGDDVRQREESWRYSKTALRALSQHDFIAADAQAEVSQLLRAQLDWPHTRGCRAVFVNGEFSAAHSDLSQLAKTISLHHGAHNKSVIAVTGGTDATTLHLVYASVPATSPSRWQASYEIDVLAGRASLIEQHIGDVGADMLGVLNSKISIRTDAQLAVTTFSDLPESVSLVRGVHTSIEANAIGRSTHALLGGRLQRFDLGVELVGVRAQFLSRGVFALRGRQHVDTQMDVRHVARDTACDIVWRGMADQRSRGIFHGGIVVAAGADGADAKLSNKNLLLSAQAEIDTQPVLEIYADEVKAAHGATVGQLDERALFYLRSRGIPLSEARTLLVSAFCQAALDEVADKDLREILTQRVQAFFPASLT